MILIIRCLKIVSRIYNVVDYSKIMRGKRHIIPSCFYNSRGSTKQDKWLMRLYPMAIMVTTSTTSFVISIFILTY